jgi:Ser/Thr protein kinase RdoA (MazF antagonist)
VRENAVFRILLAGDGRAVLRVHRYGYHSDAALRSEFEWLRALEAAGIPVPQVIPSSRGLEFESVEIPHVAGAHQIDVIRWIEGRQLGSVENSLQGSAASIETQYHAIGALMARMHNQASYWQAPPGFVRHSWDAAGLVGDQPLWGRFWELPALTPPQRRLLLATRAAVAQDLANCSTAADHFSLIHADLVPENILVDGDDMRIIDFDDAGFGWHLFDLATSLYFITGDSFYPTARAALIRGYRSKRALSDDVIDRLGLFLSARATTYLGWVHTRHGAQTTHELTPYLVELACSVTDEWLRTR